MKEALTRIEICGGIASGKTTLAKLLGRAALLPVLEKFKDNPFYLAFYRDPIGAAFETEVTFLLQHYHQQKITAAGHRGFCSDFSLVLDHAYACVTLPKDQLRLFRLILKEVETSLPSRTLLIHLVCPPEIELRRIRRRHRRAERSITVDYLERINEALRARISTLPRAENLLVFESGNTDFANDNQAKKETLQRIAGALRKTKSQ
ncbi:MAG: deoxynucleoside kinase [Nitrososphaera sp.]|nr:deoxynucleoside kinase [Nitrososphaera sp.]